MANRVHAKECERAFYSDNETGAICTCNPIFEGFWVVHLSDDGDLYKRSFATQKEVDAFLEQLECKAIVIGIEAAVGGGESWGFIVRTQDRT